MPKPVTSWWGPISASLRPGPTASCEEKYLSGGEPLATLSDLLTGSRFEPQNSFRDEHVTLEQLPRMFLEREV